MYLTKSQAKRLEVVVKDWLLEEGVSLGIRVIIECFPHEVVILGKKIKSRRGHARVQPADLTEQDWKKILEAAPKPFLAGMQLLKERGNKGIRARDFRNKDRGFLSMQVENFNQACNKRNLPYRMSYTICKGKMYDGPYAVGKSTLLLARH